MLRYFGTILTRLKVVEFLFGLFLDQREAETRLRPPIRTVCTLWEPYYLQQSSEVYCSVGWLLFVAQHNICQLKDLIVSRLTMRNIFLRPP